MYSSLVFSVDSRSYATITTINFRTFSYLKKTCRTPWSPPPSPNNCRSTFCHFTWWESHDVWCFGDGLLLLRVFNVHSCCCKYPIPRCGRMTVHCVGKSHFVYLFISWWALRIISTFRLLWIMLLRTLCPGFGVDIRFPFSWASPSVWLLGQTGPLRLPF